MSVKNTPYYLVSLAGLRTMSYATLINNVTSKWRAVDPLFVSIAIYHSSNDAQQTTEHPIASELRGYSDIHVYCHSRPRRELNPLRTSRQDVSPPWGPEAIITHY